MKKNLFLLMTFLCVILSLSLDYQIRHNVSSEVSNLALKNIEALASDEGFDDPCFWSCTFDYHYECHIFGGYPSPTYCFYYRAN